MKSRPKLFLSMLPGVSRTSLVLAPVRALFPWLVGNASCAEAKDVRPRTSRPAPRSPATEREPLPEPEWEKRPELGLSTLPNTQLNHIASFPPTECVAYAGR